MVNEILIFKILKIEFVRFRNANKTSTILIGIS